MVMVLIAGGQDLLILHPAILNGLGTTRFQTYREASLES